MVRIRAATTADGPALRDIERAAGERFRTVGMDGVADDEPASLVELASYAVDTRSWVAVDEDGGPVGYVLVDVVDGNAHVEQVSVHPDHQRRGVGRALIDHVVGWAHAHGHPALTLTTFRGVPWNAPLYEHLGFEVIAGDEVGPELAALVDAEAAHALDPTLRVCMRRPV